MDLKISNLLANDVIIKLKDIIYLFLDDIDNDTFQAVLTFWIDKNPNLQLVLQGFQLFDPFQLLNSTLNSYTGEPCLRLGFAFCRIEKWNLNKLALSKLNLLSLNYLKIENSLSFFTCINDNTSLEILSITHLKVGTYNYLIDLSNYLPVNLTKLDLKDNYFVEIPISFSNKIKASNITTLILKNCHIQDISNFNLPKDLETLDLSGNILNDCLNFLEKINGLNLKLKTLYLHSNLINNYTKYEIIEYFPNMASIESFSLLNSQDIPELICLFNNRSKIQKFGKNLLNLLSISKFRGREFRTPMDNMSPDIIRFLSGFVEIPVIEINHNEFNRQNMEHQVNLHIENLRRLQHLNDIDDDDNSLKEEESVIDSEDGFEDGLEEEENNLEEEEYEDEEEDENEEIEEVYEKVEEELSSMSGIDTDNEHNEGDEEEEMDDEETKKIQKEEQEIFGEFAKRASDAIKNNGFVKTQVNKIEETLKKPNNN